MAHGIKRKANKLQKFLDNGGIILKIKFKGEQNSKFFDIIQDDISPINHHQEFNKGYHGYYLAPCLKFTFRDTNDWGYCPFSRIRYMLVKYPDNTIKTIWI